MSISARWHRPNAVRFRGSIDVASRAPSTAARVHQTTVCARQPSAVNATSHQRLSTSVAYPRTLESALRATRRQFSIPGGRETALHSQTAAMRRVTSDSYWTGTDALIFPAARHRLGSVRRIVCARSILRARRNPPNHSMCDFVFRCRAAARRACSRSFHRHIGNFGVGIASAMVMKVVVAAAGSSVPERTLLANRLSASDSLG